MNLKRLSLITNGLPEKPVMISTPRAITIIKNAIKPTTDFSLIVLLSSNNCLKNFLIMFSFIINIKALNKIQFDLEHALLTKVQHLVIKVKTAFP